VQNLGAAIANMLSHAALAQVEWRIQKETKNNNDFQSKEEPTKFHKLKQKNF
jgi:hypothetical protein